MAENPGAGVCAYCGRGFPSRTWDHVFPRAWSGDAEAAAMEKLKVPACHKCNNSYSKAERELTLSLGMTASPTDGVMGEVAARALRSIGPSFAKNDKDRIHRRLARQKMRRRIIPWEIVDKHAESVLMGDLRNVDREQQAAFSVPGKALHAIAEKIVRGIKFLERGAPVADGYRVHVRPWRGEIPLADVVRQIGTEIRIGRSVTVRHASPSDDLNAGVFEITLWERLKILGVIEPVSPG